MSAASDRAVAYILNRIADDPRLAYYFGHTRSLELLCEAFAEADGPDAVKALLATYNSLPTEAPRCRSGECMESGRAT